MDNNVEILKRGDEDLPASVGTRLWRWLKTHLLLVVLGVINKEDAVLPAVGFGGLFQGDAHVHPALWLPVSPPTQGAFTNPHRLGNQTECEQNGPDSWMKQTLEAHVASLQRLLADLLPVFRLLRLLAPGSRLHRSQRQGAGERSWRRITLLGKLRKQKWWCFSLFSSPEGLSQLICEPASTSQPPPEIHAHTGPSSSPTPCEPSRVPRSYVAAAGASLNGRPDAFAFRAASAPSRSTFIHGTSGWGAGSTGAGGSSSRSSSSVTVAGCTTGLSRSDTRLLMKLSLAGMKAFGASCWGAETETFPSWEVASASTTGVSTGLWGSVGPNSESESVQLSTEPWEASVSGPLSSHSSL